MAKYVLSVKSKNPEFATPGLEDGIECDGFIVACFDSDGNPIASSIADIKLIDLAMMIAGGGTEFELKLLQAFAIAEGIRKSKEIGKAFREDKVGRTLAEIITKRESCD